MQSDAPQDRGTREASAPRPSRRRVLAASGLLLTAGGAGTAMLVQDQRRRTAEAGGRAEISLRSRTVAYDPSGERTLVGGEGADLTLLPGTRRAADLAADSPIHARAEAFDEAVAPWRERVASRLDAPLADLAVTALQDLWVLSDGLPAPVAGWSRTWRYVWPRDAAFCAAALARVGLPERALEVLSHLQDLQREDGWFEARYLPGTREVPDGRPRQFDGTGFALWAVREVADAPGVDRDEVRRRLARLIDTSLTTLKKRTRDGERRPPVSPDYWERRERSVTLGTMAATLAGLRAGHALTGTEEDLTASEVFTATLERNFADHDFQRYPRRGGADSAAAMLDATGVRRVIPEHVLLSLRERLARPAGGIAPGESWKQDGVSWTPSMSLLALGLARAGHTAEATDALGWLAAHRTADGSLPEKVLFDGRPAEVAPLAWTAANVLLAVDWLARVAR